MAKVRDKKYDLREIARRIEEVKKNEAGQPAAFEGFAIHEIYSILDSAVEFHPEIPDADKQRLIRKGVHTSAANSEINAENLLTQINQAEREYLSVRPSNFVLATSISVAFFAELKKAGVNGSAITFSRQLPANFKRTEIQEDIEKVIEIKNAHRFTQVRVSVKARTNASAVNDAMFNLDYLRGLWNFLVNQRTRVQFLIGQQKPRPINQIVLGPIHTLHLPKGMLATEEFWYQSQDLQYDRLYRISLIWPDVRNREAKIRRKLNRISYSKEIVRWFVRYVRALDSTDADVSFNRLWAVLEQLSQSPGKYEQLIRRVLFLVDKDERDYCLLVLGHLRDVRNGLVHDDRSRSEMRTYVFQLKWFIEQIFRYHISMGDSFESLSESCDFLDLPYGVNVLQEKVALYQKALRFRK